MQSISLTTLADEQLSTARQAASGRSAHTIYGGRQHALRQTLLALAAGHSLDDHDSPGEAVRRVRRAVARPALHGRPGTVPKAMDVITPQGVTQADELGYTVHQPVTRTTNRGGR